MSIWKAMGFSIGAHDTVLADKPAPASSTPAHHQVNAFCIHTSLSIWYFVKRKRLHVRY